MLLLSVLLISNTNKYISACLTIHNSLFNHYNYDSINDGIYIYRQTEYRAHNIKCGYEHFNVVVALGMVLRSWIYLYRYSMININVIMSL